MAMRRLCVQKIAVMQAGKFLALLYTIAALLLLPLVFIILIVNPQSGVGLLISVLLYPIIGYVGGILTAAIYNGVANFIGGIELTVEMSAATDEDITPPR